LETVSEMAIFFDAFPHLFVSTTSLTVDELHDRGWLTNHLLMRHDWKYWDQRHQMHYCI